MPFRLRVLAALYRIVREALFLLDAERAHRLGLFAAGLVARSGVLRSLVRFVYRPVVSDRLRIRAMDRPFSHPLGLAAGLDKDGQAIDFWQAIGFSFAELGTVTKDSGQPGNSGLRLARMTSDRGLVNRMGFNNLGAAHLSSQIKKKRTDIYVGANLGKSKDTPEAAAADDYRDVAEHVSSGADYLVINVSSPNTPGLRDLQAVDKLEPIIEVVRSVNEEQSRKRGRKPKPLFLKIAPDLSDEDLDAIAALSLELELDGLIATNTTISPEGLSQPVPFSGGVSGAPLCERALYVLRRLYEKTHGRMLLVGVGGISTGKDAYKRIQAGASLLQIYSTLIFQGPTAVARILWELDQHLARDGFDSVAAAVGVGALST